MTAPVPGEGVAPPAARHVRLGVPSNLPRELSSFVGRSADLGHGDGLLGRSRLLTLTGAGGCGKTRLARQLAARVAGRFPDGVWWVELASLADGALIADVVARVVGLQVPAETVAVDTLVRYLADMTCLVVLDNCEHVVEEAAGFADRVLRGTSAQVVATSREPLAVEGETTWRVPSLEVPPTTAEADSVERFDAARLFVERARQSRPGLSMSGSAAAVGQICRRLDGIPLALELAAARTGVLSLDQIVTELDDRFSLLTGGPRLALPRHRTLLASVEWSYALLEPVEQALLRRLGVFVGGFTIEAAVAVAGVAPLDPAGVLEILTRIVDRSLVQMDEPGRGPARYRLLETIRAFAVDRLVEADETTAVAGRHLGWAAGLAERLEDQVTRADGAAMDRLQVELPNLRVALDHAAAAVPPDHGGLRLVAALAFFWAQRGYALEGAEHARRVLAADPAGPQALRARAGWAGAYDRFYAFDFDSSTAEATAALRVAEAAGAEGTQGRCLHVLGANTVMVDPDASRPLFTSALALARPAGDRWCEADSMQFIGWGHLIQHRPVAVGSWLSESGAMADAAGNEFQQGWHRIGMANIATAAGQLDDAVREVRSAIALGRRVGDPAVELWGCASEVVVALACGQSDDLTRIAGEMDRPDRPLGPVDAEFVAAVRVIAELESAPLAAAGALGSVGELLLGGNDPPDGVRLLLVGAAVALAAGDVGAARAGLERSSVACAQLRSALAGACRVLAGRIGRGDGDPAAAERLVHEGLSELVDAGLWVDVPDALEVLGGLAVDAGGAAEGTRLLAAAVALNDRTGRRSLFAADVDRDRAMAAPTLGNDADRIWQEGAELDGPAAVAYARRARGERKRPAFGWESLTPTELEVVRLAAAGLTNPAIGERLFVSRGTVKTHLEHVFAKLGVRSRAELATAATRRGVV